MAGSGDEASRSFSLDAPTGIGSSFYILFGDNAYGYSSSLNDFDSYFIQTDIGAQYSAIILNTSPYGNSPAANSGIFLLNRYGTIVTGSTDFGNYSGLNFQANDTLYYVVSYSSASGFYGIRIDNTSRPETNGVGETINEGVVYSGALDFTSDSDHFYFNAVAGITYVANINSSISDLFLMISDSLGATLNYTVSSGGVYTFTPTRTGAYELTISSNSFRTLGAYTLVAGVLDTTPPSVTIFSPIDAATSVAVGTNILLTFSETIQRGTGQIQIHSGSASGPIIEAFDVASSNRLTISGNQLTIDPTNNLANSTQYFVTFAAGAVKDLAGNGFLGTSTYDFTTAPTSDTTPPTVSFFSPLDGVTGVSINTNIALTFSELIQKGTGLVQIRSGSENGTIVEAFDAATSARLTISGNQLIIDPTNDLASGVQYFVTLGAGTIKDLAGNSYTGTSAYHFTTIGQSALSPIAGTAGADIVSGSASADSISGFDGNDNITGRAGNDFIDGGSGIDRSNYQGALTEYDIIISSSNIQVIDKSANASARDGSDQLINIERIGFSNKTVVAVDIAGNAGQAYRLYKAALDRVPDAQGLAGWIKFTDDGGQLNTMAQQFIDSQEFKTKYGALDNRGFVNQLYLNVLARNGEAAGVNGWVGGLDNGMTRSQVLVGFSESSENQANVYDLIKNGIVYTEWWLT